MGYKLQSFSHLLDLIFKRTNMASLTLKKTSKICFYSLLSDQVLNFELESLLLTIEWQSLISKIRQIRKMSKKEFRRIRSRTVIFNTGDILFMEIWLELVPQSSIRVCAVQQK